MTQSLSRGARNPLRIVAVALAAAVMLVVSACTSAAEVNTGGEGTVEARTSNKIAFDYPFTSLGIYGVLVDLMTQNAEAAGYTVMTTDNPNAAVDRQISNLNSLVNSDVAAIVTFPIEPDAVQTIMQQAQAKGIKWINYGAHLEGEDGYIDFAGEATAMAQVEGFVDWAEEQGIDSGTVLVTVDDTSDLGRTRTTGMLEGMAELAPGFTVVQQPAVSTEQGLAAARAELSKDPGLLAALGLNDDVAIGLAQAFKEAGKSPSDPVFVAGNDGAPQVLQSLRAQDTVMRATIVLDINATGRALAEMPIQLIEGTGDGGFVADFVLVTAGSPEIANYLPEE
mgnify:CR=1 FL=1